MPRFARAVLPGCVHHLPSLGLRKAGVTQRGNNRQAEKVIASLRLCTSRGRPLGSDSFVSKLERRLGRRLRALPIGRPPKKKRTTARKVARNR